MAASKVVTDDTTNTEGQTTIPVPEATPEGVAPVADATVDAPVQYIEKELDTKLGWNFEDKMPVGGDDLLKLVASLSPHFEGESKGLWQAHKESLERSHALMMDIREKVDAIRKAYKIPANVMAHKVILAVAASEGEEDLAIRQDYKDGSAKASNLSAITNHSSPERYEMYVQSTLPCYNSIGEKLKRQNPTITSYGAWLKALTGNVKKQPGCTYPPHIDATSKRRVDPKAPDPSEQLDMLDKEESLKALHILGTKLEDDLAVVFGEVTEDALLVAKDYLVLYFQLRELNEPAAPRMIGADGVQCHIGDPNGPIQH